jgi:NADH:ubiquinone reductase (H+-translocating)
MHMTAKKKLVIVGAGFAGLKLARRLNNSNYDILFIDRNNYHQFQPLFYQVATARLDASEISFPIRKVFQRSKNVRILIAEVTGVSASQNIIHTDKGDVPYDLLVIAIGCTTNFFGNEKIESHAYPMKSTLEALFLRQHILQNFEDAYMTNKENEESLFNYVIVGGGPTGVETAGALAEMKKNVLPRDYPGIDASKMKVTLVEGSPALLNAMSEMAHRKSKEYLERMGVNVMLNVHVKEYENKKLQLSTGEEICTENVIWAAGVTGNKLEGFEPEIIQRGNRLKVDPFGHVVGRENIFAIGDIAYMETEKYPKGHPQLARVALDQASWLSKNLKRLDKNQKPVPFEYHDPGTMATIGKSKAVVDLPFIHFSGWLAWITWMALHIVMLMGMKNKIFVFLDWAYAYFTEDSSLRLIYRSLPTERSEMKAVEAMNQ